MAVPKKKTPKSKRNMRRSHHGLTRLRLTACAKCQQPVPSHTACANCGTYQGREVIDVLGRLEKRERVAKEQELAEHDHKH